MMLLDLLGIPEPVSDSTLDRARRVLEEHHGTPEQLVQALRKLAKAEGPGN